MIAVYKQFFIKIVSCHIHANVWYNDQQILRMYVFLMISKKYKYLHILNSCIILYPRTFYITFNQYCIVSWVIHKINEKFNSTSLTNGIGYDRYYRLYSIVLSDILLVIAEMIIENNNWIKIKQLHLLLIKLL